MEPKTGPLHSLILTAFYLASDGMPGENLFGMVACLVCLLTFRADPTVTAEVSIAAILGHDTVDECQHAQMNPADLASQLLMLKGEVWKDEVRLDWEVLIAILQHDIAKRQGKATTAENEDKDEYEDHCHHDIHKEESDERIKIIYCGNQQLGTIWAAIQAEWLTYRRLREKDTWLSPCFDMRILLRGLDDNDDECLSQLAGGDEDAEERRLRDYSHCGFFDKAENPGCAGREEACTSYYANLDDWERTTFIDARYWVPS
ncbi:hypothetical protein F4804DRAFT_83677 [Jackrogersella minutella]|nr:hypothetical protein F4804DRAFT_83677 [Jackrogersella minutella]